MPGPQKIVPQTTDRVLGRGTRLAIPFKWRHAESGDFVDLSGFTAQVWVSTTEGALSGSARPATVAGVAATYQMSETDLAQASQTTNDPVYLTCVATDGVTVLPPNQRAIVVGDWIGATDMLA
jgi:hypothetical protein